MIAKINLIVNKYQSSGFDLTLRQLYYVFGGNKYFPEDWRYTRMEDGKWRRDPNGTWNATPNYDKLGNLISDGRMAGLIDWDAIVDRTRTSNANQHWQRPSQILEATMNTYAIDKWAEQPHYVEVWVEKEALEDVLAKACSPLDVRFFATRGYNSQSAMWEASQRLVSKIADGKHVHIIHLGDHDPSGMDMSRDILDRLTTFVYHTQEAHSRFDVHRIALNMDQVEKYELLPDPAKVTDSRFRGYQERFGDESWELDALEPTLLVEVIRARVKALRDESLWEAAKTLEERGKTTLQSICMYFKDVVGFLRERRKQDVSPILCANCGATQATGRCLCGDAAPPKLLGGCQ